MADESFVLIEKKISDLVGLVAALKGENAELSAQLDQRKAEAKELARKVADLTKERNEIRERVDKILSRLETIEL
ncbi:MAG: cell division protein ZapB [Deltaproteobacteria bacterium]|nr:cell division protein ZapB [Deltaproteobacteria bacterium]